MVTKLDYLMKKASSEIVKYIKLRGDIQSISDYFIESILNKVLASSLYKEHSELNKKIASLNKNLPLLENSKKLLTSEILDMENKISKEVDNQVIRHLRLIIRNIKDGWEI